MAGAFTTFSTEIRTNSSNYPYITFLKGNSAHNVYFGKNSAERVLSMSQQEIKDALRSAEIVEAVNANGEIRFKLSISGESEYANTYEIENMFGVEAVDNNINLELFKSQFTAVNATAKA